MEISGVPFDSFTRIVGDISRNRYDSNVIVQRDAKDLHGVRKPRIRGRLAVMSSRETGARRSWNGHRMPAACWHAYRDVLAEIFRQYPDAVIKTGMSKYDGAAGFLANYPATGSKNVGSRMQPAYMPDLCDCHDTRTVEDLAALLNISQADRDAYQAQAEAEQAAARARLAAARVEMERRGAILRAVTPASTPAFDSPSTHTYYGPRTERAIAEAEQLLAEVAAEGWTNPYSDPDSPAHRLARA